MNSRTRYIALLSGMLLIPAGPALAGMMAPGIVPADAAGSFTYEWSFVLETDFVLSDLGWTNTYNTVGGLIGDCFCMPEFCSRHAGDTLRFQVTGNLVDRNSPGETYNYVFGCEGQGGASYTLIVPHTTGVGDPAVAGLGLHCEPNPCRARAHLSFELPAAGRVSLGIFDLSGRKVASLLDEARPAGAHRIDWETPASGGIARGVYFARLEFANQVKTARIFVLN